MIVCLDFLHALSKSHENRYPTQRSCWQSTWVTWGRHGLEKRGGNTEGATKKDFGAIPYFLEITFVGDAHLIFEKIIVLPKVISTNNSPNNWKNFLFFQNTFFLAKHFSKVFWKCFVATKHKSFVFCHMPNNCYHICTYPTGILLFDVLSLIILKAVK